VHSINSDKSKSGSCCCCRVTFILVVAVCDSGCSEHEVVAVTEAGSTSAGFTFKENNIIITVKGYYLNIAIITL